MSAPGTPIHTVGSHNSQTLVTPRDYKLQQKHLLSFAATLEVILVLQRLSVLHSPMQRVFS